MSTESKASNYGNLRDRVIGLLASSEDGYTMTQLAKLVNRDKKDVEQVIGKLRGSIVYIDRWETGKNGKLTAVFMCPKCPEDCPKPE